VPRRAPELAVGRGSKPDVLLHPHDAADGVILGGPQLVGVDPARRASLPRAKELRWTEQAADVVGPERRSVAPDEATVDAGGIRAFGLHADYRAWTCP